MAEGRTYGHHETEVPGKRPRAVGFIATRVSIHEGPCGFLRWIVNKICIAGDHKTSSHPAFRGFIYVHGRVKVVTWKPRTCEMMYYSPKWLKILADYFADEAELTPV